MRSLESQGTFGYGADWGVEHDPRKKEEKLINLYIAKRKEKKAIQSFRWSLDTKTAIRLLPSFAKYTFNYVPFPKPAKKSKLFFEENVGKAKFRTPNKTRPCKIQEKNSMSPLYPVKVYTPISKQLLTSTDLSMKGSHCLSENSRKISIVHRKLASISLHNSPEKSNNLLYSLGQNQIIKMDKKISEMASAAKKRYDIDSLPINSIGKNYMFQGETLNKTQQAYLTPSIK